MKSDFSFNHIALSVKDVEKSINFYKQIFKFKEIQNAASKSKTRWLSIGENKQLHLIYRPDAAIKMNKAVHFSFSTGHFENFITFLEDLNIPYSNWKNTPNKDYVREDGVKQVYFQDPDGYWIEVNNCLV
ncbi:MAG: VOC family protein [Winogradskyella sp.]|uniref:VOC family protein n=1 Tax=Winogradskyella sp. TaxID=1883156 RepID=UPI000F3C5934|nr:VOC family protein [Winogradskyella sp.]RNC86516.1 MAG: VOC family protein [Winogradskyella sp.]